ncbi:hypothetical protein GCM10022278_30310 [Allohahella marinimesophila]|uniref:Uncharacterized protein n=1 Tax=Allohahella marinimesophila TaxID=1054972 RepID=A0ABP7PSS4_9GAMM
MAAIYVSYQSNQIAAATLRTAEAQASAAAEQVAIAKEQTRLSKLQYLPRITFARELIEDKDGVRKEKVHVSNAGNALHSLDVQPFVFLHVRELALLNIGESIKRLPALHHASLPVKNFFSPVRYSVAAETGVLTTLEIPNSRVFSSVTENLHQIFRTEKISMISDIQVYFRVGYTDMFGENHERYFLVQATGESLPIPKEKAGELYERWQEALNTTALDASGPDIAVLNQGWLRGKMKL